KKSTRQEYISSVSREKDGTAEGRGRRDLLRKLADACDALALETNENRFRGRLAVDPIFDFVALRVALADLMFRFADGCDHFLAVHAHGRPAILNGFFHFRGERIRPVHRGGTLA